MKPSIELMKPWLNAIDHLDVEQVVDCYDTKALLLGTFSRETREGHEAIRAYFSEFLRKASLRCEITESFGETLKSLAVISGRYTFLVQQDSKATVREISARYTFVLKTSGTGDWKIWHHHSSVLPT